MHTGQSFNYTQPVPFLYVASIWEERENIHLIMFKQRAIH